MKIKNTILSAICGMFIVGTPMVNAAPRIDTSNVTLTVPNVQNLDADTEAMIIGLIDNLLGNMNVNVTQAQAQEILRHAQNGDAKALSTAAILHIAGLGGVEQDIHRGMTYAVQSAKQGNEQALVIVASMYLSGVFGEEYITQGIEIIELLAQHSHPYAMYVLALAYLEQGDYETSSYWYNRVASSANPEFAIQLKMVKQALLETAEQGDALAQGAAAFMYLYGAFGFEENPKEAFKWCKLAAAQGDPDSILLLGAFYEEGIGTAKNTQKAIFYYSKAAEMGVDGAQEALDALKATISRGADPNEGICNAAEYGNIEVVKLLLSQPDIDVNSEDYQGNTPLDLAEENEHPECAELIRAAGGKRSSEL